MGKEKGRASILKAVREELRLLALLVVVTEGIGTTFLILAEKDSARIAGLGIMVFLLSLLVVCITVDLRDQRRVDVQDREKGIYLERNWATARMLQDMAQATSMVFLGISNSSLCEYLTQLTQEAMTKSVRLPVESIDVFYARSDFGRMWEGDSFGKRIVEGTYGVSSYLTSPSIAATIPSLSELRFHQNSLASYYGGSLFRLSQDRELAEGIPSTIYVVLYMPLGEADTKTSYTFRLPAQSLHGLTNLLHGKYTRGYQCIRDTARLLCQFGVGNIWDWSAEAWDAFERQFPVYSRVMDDVFTFGEIHRDHKVLDIGCGAGRALENKVDQLSEGALVLLDLSPQMISAAKRLLGHRENVHFIAGDATMPLFGSYEGQKFDRVIAHFSAPALIEKCRSVQRFASTLTDKLRDTGQVVLVIHNSFIECERPPGFEKWSDPLRQELEQAIISKGLQAYLRRELKRKFSAAEIKEGFREAGFALEDCRKEVYARSMRDRIAMWRAPAVSDSFVDIIAIGQNKWSALLEEVEVRVGDKETMPTTVLFFRFSFDS